MGHYGLYLRESNTINLAMKIFCCDNCGQLVYFENTYCNKCKSPLGYCPDTGKHCSFEIGANGIWTSIGPTTKGRQYKQCKNYTEHSACNWMVPIESKHQRCISCNLNWVLPELDLGENKQYWRKIERAKRRLVFSILRMKLPLKNKKEDKHNGLSFKFLEGPGLNSREHKPVSIGHNRGVITLNIAEANDSIRMKIRDEMKERYRTLLGHFRHEVGHYYWMVLVENSHWLEPCRKIFGDEREDYNKSLQLYYEQKTKSEEDVDDVNYITSYASSHPWEDWAETWAHYMHIYDTLETASSWGLRFSFHSVRYSNRDHIITGSDSSFDKMIDNWNWASCALNSLNRSMGFSDPYPFMITQPVKDKLHFIHSVIHENPAEEFVL